jgi:hypothetical protein
VVFYIFIEIYRNLSFFFEKLTKFIVFFEKKKFDKWTPLFHLKNRLKTRVALLELLDLSDIAVGNVGVPTCLLLLEFLLKLGAELRNGMKVRK